MNTHKRPSKHAEHCVFQTVEEGSCCNTNRHRRPEEAGAYIVKHREEFEAQPMQYQINQDLGGLTYLERSRGKLSIRYLELHAN